MSSHNNSTTESPDTSASAWSAQSFERPLPDPEAGKIMRTIWHWETNEWEHEYEKQTFSWEERQYYTVRKPCSLPLPPIPRPPPDPTCGMVVRTIFDWESSRWEHCYQRGAWYSFPPSSFASLESLPLVGPLPPPLPAPRLPSPHPTFGRATGLGFDGETGDWSVTYEDGTVLPVSMEQLEQMFPSGLPF